MRGLWGSTAFAAAAALLIAGCGGKNVVESTPTARPSTSPTGAMPSATAAPAESSATPAPAVDPCTLRKSLEGLPLGTGPAFTLDGVAWQICVGGAAAGSSEKFLFKTTDGGATWALISRTTLGNPPPEPGVGELPNGNAAQALFFTDEQHGWLGLSSPGENLFRTDDGGVTWTAVPGLPPGLPVLEISFSDATHGQLTTPEGAWTTSDGGQTWSQTP